MDIMRILIAEDEKDLNRLIVSKLEAEHYSVDRCFDGEEALSYLTSAEYDLAILDIMMPKLDGLTLLRTLRKSGIGCPVLLLTARDSIEDRVTDLDSGANDYLVKPFAFEELLARVRVLLRAPNTLQESCLHLADLTMQLDTHKVFRGTQEISLSGKEFMCEESLPHYTAFCLSPSSAHDSPDFTPQLLHYQPFPSSGPHSD